MPIGEPGVELASMLSILPASGFEKQSIQVLPWLELKANTGWLKTLKASKRNSAFTRSVILNFFAIERSEKNARGPVNVLCPASPNVPQAGSENPPDTGRARVQESVPLATPARL